MVFRWYVNQFAMQVEFDFRFFNFPVFLIPTAPDIFSCQSGRGSVLFTLEFYSIIAVTRKTIKYS